MKPANEIRRENLKALADKFGGVARLAERIDRSSAQISQWINASKDSKTGKPRTISDKSARFIEQQLGLPENWLDHDHTPAGREVEGSGEASTNMLFDPAGLTRSQRELLEAIITSLPAMDDDTAGAIKTIALNSSKEKQRG